MVIALGPWAIAGAAIALLGFEIYKNWDRINQLLPLITAAVAVLAAAFLTFNVASIAAGISTLSGAFLLAASSAKAFGLALLANPVGAVLLVIGTALAAFTFRVLEAQAAMGEMAT